MTEEGNVVDRMSGQVSMITGAGMGLGREISEAFASEGSTVVAVDVDEGRLAATATAIRDCGGKVQTRIADVSDEVSVCSVVQQVDEAFGGVDVLVNNAGIAGPTVGIDRLRLDDWQAVLAVNLTGAMLCTREVARRMIHQRAGVILNISSGAGKIGTPLRSPYVASKWALIGLTQTWAMELGRYGIRVNCVCPGFVEGDRIDRVFRARAEAMGTSYEVERGSKESASPMGRLVKPSEVTAACTFLASSEASGMTGQAINVSAGVEMR